MPTKKNKSRPTGHRKNAKIHAALHKPNVLISQKKFSVGKAQQKEKSNEAKSKSQAICRKMFQQQHQHQQAEVQSSEQERQFR